MAQKHIPIFELVDIVPERNTRSPQKDNTFVGSSSRALKTMEQGVEEVTESMTNFIEGVQSILAQGAQVKGGFQMKQVEVQASISLEGKVGFLGTGASAQGGAQMKITFERKPTLEG